MLKLKDGFKGSRMIVLPPPVVEAMGRDPFTAKLYLTDIGHFPHAEHHFRQRPEGTDAWILLYCTDGKGWIEYRGTRHTLGPGQSFIIPAGAPHTYGADEQAPWTLYWVHFQGELAPYFAEGCDRVCSMADPDHDRITGRTTLFEELYLAVETGFGDAQLRYACATLYHFLGTFRYLQAGYTPRQDGRSLGIIERCRSRGEIVGSIGVFDGCGGLGARQYKHYEDHTGAYIASRIASGAVYEWFQLLKSGKSCS